MGVAMVPGSCIPMGAVVVLDNTELLSGVVLMSVCIAVLISVRTAVDNKVSTFCACISNWAMANTVNPYLGKQTSDGLVG